MALGPEDEEGEENGQSKAKVKPKAPMSSGPKLTCSKAASGARRRRTRCRRCAACQKHECGDCHFCKDMRKFGGPGRMKQSCLQRQCTAPVLPHTAVCLMCWEAGKEDSVEGEEEKFSLSLMECTICNEIVHPGCLKVYDIEGFINDEIPNCWECPKCRREGKSGKDGREQSEGVGKRRPEGEEGPRWKLEEGVRQRSDDYPAPNHRKADEGHRRRKERDGAVEGGAPQKKKQKMSRAPDDPAPSADQSRQRQKLEHFKRMCQLLDRAPSPSSSSEEGEDGGGSGGGGGGTPAAPLTFSASEEEEGEEDEEPAPPPAAAGGGRAAGRQRDRSARPGPAARRRFLNRPPVSPPPRPLQMERHLVRPPPHCPEPDWLPLDSGADHVLQRRAWLAVFRHLGQRDLCVCMRVCRTLNRWCCDRQLWTKIDLSRQKTITPAMLSGIVRRQPVVLDLSWSPISKKQLMWLINRLQGLTELILSGCSWTSVSALCTAGCFDLRRLDLCWVEDLKDSHLRELVSPPADCRPGQSEVRGRLQNVTELRLAGLALTDASLRLLGRQVPRLRALDLSHCPHVGDQSVHLLTAVSSPLRDSLAEINLSGCPRLTDHCLALLHRCRGLRRVDLRSCRQVSAESCRRFAQDASSSAGSFRCPEDRLILHNR